MLIIISDNIKNSLDMHLFLEQKKILSIVRNDWLSLAKGFDKNQKILVIIDKSLSFIREMAITLRALNYQKQILIMAQDTNIKQEIIDIFGEYNLNNINFLSHFLKEPKKSCVKQLPKLNNT